MSRERKQRRDERRYGSGGNLYRLLIQKVADAERRSVRTTKEFNEYVRELKCRGVITSTIPTPQLPQGQTRINLDHPSLAACLPEGCSLEFLFGKGCR